MSATSWISGHASERHASHAASAPKPASVSALAAEIGLNDPLVRLDGARRPFRDLLAVVEDEDEQLAPAALRLRARAARDDEQVLEGRQLREDADDLEGAADAAAGDLPGLEPVDALAAKRHAAGVEPLDARDAVEERRLARAVGADEAVDARGLQRQRHIVHGGHAAEALAHALHGEHGRHPLRPRPLSV